MTRLDRLLKLLEEYDSLVAIAFTHYCVGQDCRKMLEYLRLEKQNSDKNLSSTVVGGRTDEKTFFDTIYSQR